MQCYSMAQEHRLPGNTIMRVVVCTTITSVQVGLVGVSVPQQQQHA